MVEQENMQQIVEGGADNMEKIEDAAVYESGAADDGVDKVSIGGEAMKYTVKNPHDKNGHIVYEVAGNDKHGEWNGLRRFNEFYTLHQIITKRWPGIPIPCVPPKKAIGNKDLVFIQERRFYLEQFLRKMTAFPFIIEGEEWQTFARPQSGVNIEKSLGNMGMLTSQQMYDRIKEAVGVNDAMYDMTEKETFKNRITEYTFFVKKIEPYLKYLKNELAQFLTTKQLTINNYKNLGRMWNIYEEVNLTAYVDMSARNLVLNNPDNEQTKQALQDTSSLMKNPFVDVFHWTKGQILDLNAISAAIVSRGFVEAQERKLTAKKISDQKDLDNINAGTKSLGTVFKNKGDTGKIAQ